MKIGTLIVVCVMCSALGSAQNAHPPLYFAVAPGSFYTQGRWVPEDSKAKADFPSETRIDCDQRGRTCTEAIAELYSGHPHISLDYFTITSWDADGIVARNTDAVCMTQTLLVSFADKNVSLVHSQKELGKDLNDACKTLGATGTQTDVFIVKNSQRWIADPYGESLFKQSQ